MILRDGYQTLKSLERLTFLYVRERIIGRVDQLDVEFSITAPVFNRACSVVARTLIQSAAYQRFCDFYALPVSGEVVQLAPSIFEKDSDAQKRFRIATSQRQEVDGKYRYITPTYEKLISESFWVEDALEQFLGNVENEEYYLTERRVWPPSDPNKIPKVNWIDGTIDFSRARALASINEQIFAIGQEAVIQGFELPARLFSRRYEYHVSPLARQLDGCVIVLTDDDMAKHMKLWGEQEDEDRNDMSPVEQILDICEKNPTFTKAKVKAEFFGDMSVRRFNVYWAIAASERPSLSKPGRKS